MAETGGAEGDTGGAEDGLALVSGGTELPGGDDEHGYREDADQSHDDGVGLGAAATGTASVAGGDHGLLGEREAGVVLVDVELAVEAEPLRVRPQEALDVRVARQRVELLLLESAKVPRSNLRLRLELRELEALADARVAQAVADLEHAGGL